MAKQIFANEDSARQNNSLSTMGDDIPGEVVGVVGDVNSRASIGEVPADGSYYPHPHLPGVFMTLVVKTTGDPGSYADPRLE